MRHRIPHCPRPLAVVLLFAAAFCGGLPATAPAACPSAEAPREVLVDWRDKGFPVPDATRHRAFLPTLADCLSSPDPELRDTIGFAGVQAILRGARHSYALYRAVFDSVLAPEEARLAA